MLAGLFPWRRKPDGFCCINAHQQDPVFFPSKKHRPS
nr:MAG TPA_asm: hypothetical protein [Caudoviricetes sp.]